MSFVDIFKQSFLEGYSNTILSTKTILIAMLISFSIGLFIFFIYKFVTRKTFYSTSFNVSLVAMSVITSAIILTIQSSIVVSLGMVGALSIVRFRTAIKDPIDLVFLFWSISVGIICGAGLAEIAIILSLIVTVAIIVLQRLPLAKPSMILIVNSSEKCEEEIIEKVKKESKSYRIKSRNIVKDSMEMIIEIRIENNSNLIHKITQIEGVNAASMMSHNGDITV